MQNGTEIGSSSNFQLPQGSVETFKVMWNIFITYLHIIFLRMCQWKNFDNRRAFVEAMTKR